MTGQSAGPLPLVGRLAEAQALARFLSRVAGGSEGSVVIEGEAGLGKSRLLDEVLLDLHPGSVRVIRAAAHKIGRNRPFGLLGDALKLDLSSEDAELASIARLLWAEPDDLRQAATVLPGGPSRQYVVLEAILGYIERRATEAPILLTLEDLHWADASTLLTLDAMRRRLVHLPVGLLTTRRLDPTSADLEALIDALQAGGGTRLRLAPLDEGQIETLSTSVAGAPPGDGLRAHLRGTGGNPFYVVELVRALAADGSLRIEGNLADVCDTSIPAGLTFTLVRRLGDLSQATLEVLRLASVLGTIFDVTRLSRIAGRSAVDLVAPLEEAMRAGVLRELKPHDLDFRHDLIREALYLEIAAPIRAGLHVHIGRVLADLGAEPVVVAEHFALGAPAGDLEAVKWLHDAAHASLSQSPESAVQLLTRGVEIAGTTEAARPLREELVVANLWSGRIPESEALCHELLSDKSVSADRTALRLQLLHALLAQGKTLEAGTEIELAMKDPTQAAGASAQLQAWAAFGQILANDLEAGSSLAASAHDEAVLANDDLAVCLSLCALSLVATYRGRLGEAIELSQHAIDRAEQSETTAASQLNCGLFLATALTEADRFDDARAAILRGRGLSHRVGARWNLPLYHWTAVMTCFSAGQWDDALAEAETGFQLAEEVASHFGEVGVHCMLGVIAFHRNDMRNARAARCRAETDLHTSGPQHRSEWVLWLRALEAQDAGDDAGALAALGKAWDSCVDLGLAWDLPVLGPDLVRLVRRGGDVSRARSIALEVGVVAARMGSPSARGSALRCEGLAEADPEILLEAVRVLGTSPRPLDRALAAEDAGTALVEAGRTEEAIDLLDQASAEFEVLHAMRDLARVGAALRRLGVRRGQRGSRSGRPQLGWDSLTPTERAVSALVAEGLANREVAERLFIGHRTVETHIRHIFAKMGVGSRRELKDAARQAAAGLTGGG